MNGEIEGLSRKSARAFARDCASIIAVCEDEHELHHGLLVLEGLIDGTSIDSEREQAHAALGCTPYYLGARAVQCALHENPHIAAKLALKEVIALTKWLDGIPCSGPRVRRAHHIERSVRDRLSGYAAP